MAESKAAPAALARIDAEVLRLGEELWKNIRGKVPGVFDKNYWQGVMLDWSMRDPSFKVDLFRFVDVLPVLAETGQVSAHVKEYLLKEGRSLPWAVTAALKMASGGLTAGMAVRALRKNVEDLASRFIAGSDPRAALPALKNLHAEGIGFTVDLLGESTLGFAEAKSYRERYLDLLHVLSEEAPLWPADDVVDRDHAGPLPRVNISLKLSALDPHLDAVDPEGGVARLKEFVLPIFLAAKERGAFVNVDLENWEVHEIAYRLFEEAAFHPDLKGWPHIGIVVQAYLRSAEADVERLLDLARRRGAPLTVRLVKGAYWDYEVVRSRQHGYPCPVFTDKAETDASFERITRRLLENHVLLRPAIGSHNLRSVLHALVLAREMKVPDRALEFQMLYGMAEPEREVLRASGLRLRVYAPVGELLPGMAYLVRRLLENTSNSGFLRRTYHEEADLPGLLARPAARGGAPVEPAAPAMRSGDLSTPFENCPLSDFTDPKVRAAFARAVRAVEASLPREVAPVIEGKARRGSRTVEIPCPHDLARRATSVRLASKEEAEAAVEAAWKAWPAWRDRPVADRALLLDKLADRLAADRVDLAAVEALETAKPWREADADVAEAVDFCRYYARQAMAELAPRRVGRVPGEDNVFFCEGRGPAAIIAPWNFPLAILCGMTAAALVAGNTVIIKPAEPSSAVGAAFHERLIAAGFPADVAGFLPGEGGEVGRLLVEHPKVAVIAFTGSKEVGLSILAAAARVAPGQTQVKKVICEMGGKNAIVVDEDADLDEAVSGVIRSAFGYAGQKCSACSRVLVVGSAYERFIPRLVEACRSLSPSPAHEPGCRVPPVIAADAARRLREAIAKPGEGARPLHVGEARGGGHYVPIAVFEVHDVRHRLMQEELFGPVLAVMKAASFEEALDLAVSTEFALTGAVYSRLPSHLDLAARRFRVGNLYLNRGCTGALVFRQPFGGFGMSGTGAKAGGPGYLLQFADARCVTENTMRHGFTPELA